MSDNSSPSVREKTIQEKIQLSPIEKFVKYGSISISIYK